MHVAEYFRRADQHRPADRETLRAAVAELHGRGLRVRDIAQAIGVAEAEVRRLLGEGAP